MRHFSSLLRVDPDFGLGFCATGMVMMPRNLWEESSGFDEKLIHWGWMEIDLGVRVSRQYPSFNLTKLGMILCHLEHFAPETERISPRKSNPQNKDNVFRPNNDDWGLNKYELEVFSYPEGASDSESVVQGQPVRSNKALLSVVAWVIVAKIGRTILWSMPEPVIVFYDKNRKRFPRMLRTLKNKPITQ